MVLLLASFVAGIAFVLTPCTLPVLPALLAVSSSASRRRAWGVVFGLIVTFSLAALFLSAVIRALDLPPDILRTVAVVVLAVFGLVLIVPALERRFERMTAGLSRRASRSAEAADGPTGFWSGLALGASLAFVWAPCAGPIYASIVVASSVSGRTGVLMTAFAVGMVIPLAAIVFGGRRAVDALRRRVRHPRAIPLAMGSVLLATSLAIALGLDTRINTALATNSPVGAAWLEDFENWAIEQDREAPPPHLDRLDEEVLRYHGYPQSEQLEQLGPAPELAGLGPWFNTPGDRPLERDDLAGKVVLVDFWTYSCINCIRTFPYLRDWHERYADDGLVILGVHSPEFDFERVPENVRDAVRKHDLRHPIAIDNDFATWQAFSNRYWPAKYLIDRDGKLRYVHYGEGSYEETEAHIRTLLELEPGRTSPPATNEATDTRPQGAQVTRETYLNHGRGANFAGRAAGSVAAGMQPDTAVRYRAPEPRASNLGLQPDEWTFTGEWTIEEGRSVAGRDAGLALRYQATEVHLVMGPARGSSATVTAIVDGERRPLRVAFQDLHTLRDGPGHRDGIILLDIPPGVAVYAFTFG